MFVNGVRTGMVVTAAVLRPILQDHHLALPAWAVAAAGTTARRPAEYRIVAATSLAAATAISGCAFAFRSINT